MKRKEFLKNLEGKSAAELKADARNLCEDQMKMTFRRVSSTLKETHLIGINRKNRARVLTKLNSGKKA